MQLQVILVGVLWTGAGFRCRMCHPAFGFRRVLTCVECYALAQGLPRVDTVTRSSVHGAYQYTAEWVHPKFALSAIGLRLCVLIMNARSRLRTTLDRLNAKRV